MHRLLSIIVIVVVFILCCDSSLVESDGGIRSLPSSSSCEQLQSFIDQHPADRAFVVSPVEHRSVLNSLCDQCNQSTVLQFSKHLRRLSEYVWAEEVVDQYLAVQSDELFATTAIISEIIRHTAALHQIGESHRAERWLKKSIEQISLLLPPSSPSSSSSSLLPHYNRLRMELITCLLMQGINRRSEAIELIRSLIADDPEHIPAIYYLVRLTKKQATITQSLVSHLERLRWTPSPSPLCYLESVEEINQNAADMNWRDWPFRSSIAANRIPIDRYSGFIPSPSWTIPRLSYPVDEFDYFVRQRQPFIIESGAFSSLEWRVDHWKSDYLKKKAGDEMVWVEKRVEGMPFGFEPLKIRTNFSSFIDRLDNSSLSMSDWYLNTQGSDAIVDPPLRRFSDDLTLPKWLEGRRIKSVNMWMGHASESGGTSNLHHDDDDNLYALIEGRKEIVLYSPADAFFLYPVGRIGQIFSNGYTSYVDQPSRWGKDWYSDNFSMIPPDQINRTDLWPALRHTRPYKVSLDAGEMLFIPSGWWHQVSSFGRNLAINFWWTPAIFNN